MPIVQPPTNQPRPPERRGKRLPPLPAPRMLGRESQPVSTVRWVKRDSLHQNVYNPNHVAPNELYLLKVSILEDGWTQPIVIREDGEVVDGFHRWTVSGDPEIYAMTDGWVPVVLLKNIPGEHQVMSTIRHNRARGSHAVLAMADIVRNLIERDGLSMEEVMARLSMEREEVERLYDRGDILKRQANSTFRAGWVPEGSKQE